jgi:hypothetical protein
MELMVRPIVHTKVGLTIDEVLEVVLESIQEYRQRNSSFQVGVVIYVNTDHDGM